jgi:hypothetical protein
MGLGGNEGEVEFELKVELKEIVEPCYSVITQ